MIDMYTSVTTDPRDPDTRRLVAMFPLNGSLDCAYRIYIHDEHTAIEHYSAFTHDGSLIPNYRMQSHRFATFGNAVVRCMRECGWGDYRMVDAS